MNNNEKSSNFIICKCMSFVFIMLVLCSILFPELFIQLFTQNNNTKEVYFIKPNNYSFNYTCDWSDWSSCEPPCGNGIQYREIINTTYCDYSIEYQDCYTMCNICDVSEWGNWSLCIFFNQICGLGYQLRNRNITSNEQCYLNTSLEQNRTCYENCTDKIIHRYNTTLLNVKNDIKNDVKNKIESINNYTIIYFILACVGLCISIIGFAYTRYKRRETPIEIPVMHNVVNNPLGLL